MATAHLYKVTSLDDFEDYYRIKSDPTAILWSGFSSAPNKVKLFEHFKTLLESIEEGRKVLFYIKDNNDNLIGYDLLTQIDDETIESSGHSILSSWQGKGMGTVLFSLLKKEVREMGYHYFTGWISENNIGSIKNVERNGFLKTEETRSVRLAAFDRVDVFYKYICVL